MAVSKVTCPLNRRRAKPNDALTIYERLSLAIKRPDDSGSISRRAAVSISGSEREPGQPARGIADSD